MVLPDDIESAQPGRFPMPTYKAPLRDIQFVMNEVLDTESLYQSLPG